MNVILTQGKEPLQIPASEVYVPSLNNKSVEDLLNELVFEVGVGKAYPHVQIKDDEVSAESTYSSEKIESLVGGGSNGYQVLAKEWASYVSAAINHTFTAYQKGQYLVVSAIGDNGSQTNSITSTGTLVYQRYSTYPGARHAFIYLYNLDVDDTITVKSDNYSGGSYRGTNAIICRLDGSKEITNLSLVQEGFGSDGAVTKTTYLEPEKFYITIGISSGIDENSSDSITGSYAENVIISNWTRVHFIQSIGGSQITQTQYGNQAGGASIGVFEVIYENS